MALALGKHFLKRKFLNARERILHTIRRTFYEFDTVTEVSKKGYNCEVHKVTTEDGYNLTLHRVRAPQCSVNESLQRKPVMIQHGLSCNSSDWVVLEDGLVYRLVDEGCDVWLGNTRGNSYSRSHNEMSSEDPKFWDFSWHEMGYYDLPSMIDYILEDTQHSNLTYIGHSQGSCAFFVMASTRPEYNEKIGSMFALGPVACLPHVGSILLKQLAVRSKVIHRTANAAGISYITIDTFDTMSKLFNVFAGRVKILDESMTYILSSLWGYPCKDLRENLFSLWMGHVKNGLSLKQLVHFAQSLSGEYWFHMYDYGSIENEKLYGQATPPPYPLHKISAPVSLLYGPADWLAHPLDVRSLYAALMTDKKLIEMPLPMYNHLDFCWSRECLNIIVERVLHSHLSKSK